MKTRTVKKTMDDRRVGGPQEDENPRLASEDTRSTGLEKSYAGGQGPNWTVALDWRWRWWWWWLWWLCLERQCWRANPDVFCFFRFQRNQQYVNASLSTSSKFFRIRYHNLSFHFTWRRIIQYSEVISSNKLRKISTTTTNIPLRPIFVPVSDMLLVGRQ